MTLTSMRSLAAGSFIGAAIVCLAFAAADAAAEELVAFMTACAILLASGLALLRVRTRAMHAEARCSSAIIAARRACSSVG